MSALDESMDVGQADDSIIVLSPIANPLATDKLAKKILKLVKSGVCFVIIIRIPSISSDKNGSFESEVRKKGREGSCESGESKSYFGLNNCHPLT